MEEGQAYPVTYLEREGSGGVALVYGEAQTPVRVWDEDQVPGLGVAEGLDVTDQHLVTLAGFYLQQRAEFDTGLFHCSREPGVAVTVYADNGGHEGVGALLAHAGELHTCERGGVQHLPETSYLQPRCQMRRRWGEDV